MRPRNCRVIRTDLLRGNMQKIRKAVPEGTKVLAVVKADGYGHGGVETSRAALAENDVMPGMMHTSKPAARTCSFTGAKLAYTPISPKHR